MPHGLVQRARIVLACAEGVTNAKVAAQLGVSASTVGK
ncbi:MAG: helix-turn-helix domain-containing protein [Bacteroidota bacterium]|nr:helix-turn-helix domain-containing protein [Bacteroidota bacterium]